MKNWLLSPLRYFLKFDFDVNFLVGIWLFLMAFINLELVNELNEKPLYAFLFNIIAGTANVYNYYVRSYRFQKLFVREWE